jgi:hypothetical protein
MEAAMTTFATANKTTSRLNWMTLAHQAWQANRLLTVAAAFHLLLVPAFLLAWLVDPLTILGQPAWIKPLKFAISGAIYALTFVWMLGFVQGWPRWKAVAAGATGVALIIESSLIALQVLRGTTSHFNFATPFDSAVFRLMAGFIVLLALCSLLLAILLLVQRLPNPVMAGGLRLGVVSALAGMMVAFLMTVSPTPSQQARLAAGEPVTMIGAHSVGVEDGGPGLPLLGWSTEGGDYRVPHFVGLHGMQILPLAAWLLTLPPLHRRLPQRHRLLLVWTLGLGYLGLTALLTWQALRGQSIIAPDGATWSTLAVLTSAVALVATALWLDGRRRRPMAKSRADGLNNQFA